MNAAGAHKGICRAGKRLMFLRFGQVQNIPSNTNIATIQKDEKLREKGLNDCRKDANVLGICKTYDKNETGG